MPTGQMMPGEKRQFFDNAGAVLNGGKIYFYEAGTTTPLNVYQNAALTTPHAQPVVLDAAGRATIYFPADSFKVVVKTSADVELYTVDDVMATQLNQSLLADTIRLGGDANVAWDDTSYPSGSTNDKILPGTQKLPLDSETLVGNYVLRGMLESDNAGRTVSVALVNLTDAANTAMVTISSSSVTPAHVSTGRITFASAGAEKQYALKGKISAAGAGRGGCFELVRDS